MGVRKLNPVTPASRFRVVNDFKEITASKPEKSLVTTRKKSGGRNGTGKMTMRYTGGGHKQNYRIIDFKRNKEGIPATVKTIEYDPNRSARIARLKDHNNNHHYVLASTSMHVGQTIESGQDAPIEHGNRLPLSSIPP